MNKLASRMQTRFRSSGEKKVDKQTRSLFLCPRDVTFIDTAQDCSVYILVQ